MRPAADLPVDRGRWGEDVAHRYLRSLGWSVLDRNYRAARAEIDLIAERDGVIAFVEVKTRSEIETALESIHSRKQRSIARAADCWAAEKGHREYTYRFDAIAVVPVEGSSPQVDHLADAWRPAAYGDWE